MRRTVPFLLAVCCISGCGKPAQQGVTATAEVWADTAKAYNRASGAGLAKRPAPQEAIDVKAAEFLTDEVLYDQRTVLAETVLGLSREAQSHLATTQLGELAALAIDIETLRRVSNALKAENDYAQGVERRAQQLLAEMNVWAAALNPKGGPKREVEAIPAGLINALRTLGPAAVAYPQEIETFRAFLERNWGEFWIADGVRMLRRPGFEGDYTLAAKRLVEARKKYELTLQQIELQTRAKAR